MNKEANILLVFAESDDQQLEGNHLGWVSSFNKFFTSLFKQISGNDPEIKKCNENQLTPAEVENADVVLFVMSPAALEQNPLINTISGWVQMSEGGAAATKLFIVHKSSISYEEELPELSGIISYDLYFVDPMTGESQEFRRFFGQDAERGYWMKLIDLAYDVLHVLDPSIQQEEIEETAKAVDQKIYLATTGVDLLIHRDIIKRELKRHGYQVFPSQTLPKDMNAMEQSIRDDLAECTLSIHLVGEDYGYRPLGSDRSVVDWQNQLANEHLGVISKYNETALQPKKFSRLIWITPELKNVSERQKIFIDDIKSEAAQLSEAEVLQVSLNEFKAVIKEELETGGRFKAQKKKRSRDELKSKGKSVYFIHDKNDIKTIDPLKQYLTKKGYEVLSPSFEGDVMDIRFVHESNLRRCDGSIIYFGQTTEEWIKTKLQDLLKAPGFGRSKPEMAKALVVTGHKEIDRDSLSKYRTIVVEDDEGNNSNQLDGFIAKLEEL